MTESRSKNKAPRILILTDIEGIAGIGSIEEIDRENIKYKEAREKLMLDTNAAADGAFRGGAEKIFALDGHGGGNNFIDEMLDNRVLKEKRKFSIALTESKPYEAIIVIGAHAMAGTLNGFLDHTQDSKSWFNYYVNGRKSGEIAQWALMAGARDIPIIMVSGDEAACVEARAFLGGVETAAVKQGKGRNTCIVYSEKNARGKITAAAEEAVRNYGRYTPLKIPPPLEIRLEVYRSDMADDIMERRDDCERLDARTVRRTTDNPIDIYF